MSNVLGVQIRQCIQNLNHVGTSSLLRQWLVLLLNQIEEFTTLALLNHLRKTQSSPCSKVFFTYQACLCRRSEEVVVLYNIRVIQLLKVDSEVDFKKAYFQNSFFIIECLSLLSILL